MSTENSMTRVVALDGGINFRDIGGYINDQGARLCVADIWPT